MTLAYALNLQDKDSLYSAGTTTVSDFQIEFTLSQEQRVTPPGFDGNPSNLTDLRSTPILVISGEERITVSLCMIPCKTKFGWWMMGRWGGGGEGVCEKWAVGGGGPYSWSKIGGGGFWGRGQWVEGGLIPGAKLL